MRSLLIVPADSPHKLEKAPGTGADAIIIDLEDSVLMSEKARARQHVRTFLERTPPKCSVPKIFVRVNGLDTDLIDADLDAVMPAEPHGIVLPKSRNGADIERLANKIAVREAEKNIIDGATSIIAFAAGTPSSIFGLGSYIGASRRLIGLAWAAEDLSAALGTESIYRPDGSLSDPFQLARNLTLIAAHAASVEPIDAFYLNFRDEAGLKKTCEAARRDGFSCKLAIHPDQIAPINECFTASTREIAEAQKIIDAFSAQPQSAVITMHGVAYGPSHLVRAQKLLCRAR